MRPLGRLLVLAISLAMLGGPIAGPSRTAAAGPPNIVIVYLDDVSPHDGRLWSDPSLTPTLHRLFVERGVHLPNAIGESPLCCPGRGNLLTGLHTHNNGLNSNHPQKFDPSEHLGHALQRAGYATMYLGKYLNRADTLTAADWAAHAAGWTHFDVTKGVNGQFYDYTLFTKSGDLRFTDLHSTRMVAERFVMRARQTPADQPLFALLSIYNLHAPNTPLPEFAGDQRCAAMPPWNPPNYNEADMSDKPAFMQGLPLQPYSDGWPMVRYCEEMLGVDWAVQQVVDELEAQRRLDNTLLIFTGDNGMAWGAHRLGQVKIRPSTTRVPLYMRWPARWGSERRTINEHTSNIDLAPTMCHVAGCRLGPFRSGHSGPDGVSLLPLLDGTVRNLGRDALLEEYLNPADRMWTALRTTSLHPAGLWHYVEWATGERELYDLAADPWELDNLAGRSSTASLRTSLAQRLARLRQEGVVTRQPDGMIAFTATGTYKGNNVYASAPLSSQTRTRSGVGAGTTHSFFVRVQNDGSAPDAFRLLGTENGTTTITVRYFAGTTEITAPVKAGTYTTTQLKAGGRTRIEVRIAVPRGTPIGSVKRALVRAASVAQPAKVDLVRAVVSR